MTHSIPSRFLGVDLLFRINASASSVVGDRVARPHSVRIGMETGSSQNRRSSCEHRLGQEWDVRAGRGIDQTTIGDA
jgi:hypothetical protein